MSKMEKARKKKAKHSAASSDTNHVILTRKSASQPVSASARVQRNGEAMSASEVASSALAASSASQDESSDHIQPGRHSQRNEFGDSNNNNSNRNSNNSSHSDEDNSSEDIDMDDVDVSREQKDIPSVQVQLKQSEREPEPLQQHHPLVPAKRKRGRPRKDSLIAAAAQVKARPNETKRSLRNANTSLAKHGSSASRVHIIRSAQQPRDDDPEVEDEEEEDEDLEKQLASSSPSASTTSNVSVPFESPRTSSSSSSSPSSSFSSSKSKLSRSDSPASDQQPVHTPDVPLAQPLLPSSSSSTDSLFSSSSSSTSTSEGKSVSERIRSKSKPEAKGVSVKKSKDAAKAVDAQRVSSAKRRSSLADVPDSLRGISCFNCGRRLLGIPHIQCADYYHEIEAPRPASRPVPPKRKSGRPRKVQNLPAQRSPVIGPSGAILKHGRGRPSLAFLKLRKEMEDLRELETQQEQQEEREQPQFPQADESEEYKQVGETAESTREADNHKPGNEVTHKSSGQEPTAKEPLRALAPRLKKHPCRVRLCLDCFSVGAEIYPHKRAHNYSLVEPLEFPVLDVRWRADEELRLANALMRLGPGDWKGIANLVGSKSKHACKKHYYECMIPNEKLDYPLGPEDLRAYRRQRKEEKEKKRSLAEAQKDEQTTEPIQFPAAKKALFVDGTTLDQPKKSLADAAKEPDVSSNIDDLDCLDSTPTEEPIRIGSGVGPEAAVNRAILSVESPLIGIDSPEPGQEQEQESKHPSTPPPSPAIDDSVIQLRSGNRPGLQSAVLADRPRRGRPPGRGARGRRGGTVPKDRQKPSGSPEQSKDKVILGGYLPKRGDFDHEWDDGAENILADLALHEDDTEESVAFKVRLMELYNCRLDDREEKKKFVLEHDMLDFERIRADERRRPKEQRDFSMRLRAFSRVQSNDEQAELEDALIQEFGLYQRMEELAHYRSMGIRTQEEAQIYQLEQKKRVASRQAQQQRSTKDATYELSPKRPPQRGFRYLNRDSINSPTAAGASSPLLASKVASESLVSPKPSLAGFSGSPPPPSSPLTTDLMMDINPPELMLNPPPSAASSMDLSNMILSTAFSREDKEICSVLGIPPAVMLDMKKRVIAECQKLGYRNRGEPLDETEGVSERTHVVRLVVDDVQSQPVAAPAFAPLVLDTQESVKPLALQRVKEESPMIPSDANGNELKIRALSGDQETADVSRIAEAQRSGFVPALVPAGNPTSEAAAPTPQDSGATRAGNFVRRLLSTVTGAKLEDKVTESNPNPAIMPANSTGSSSSSHVVTIRGKLRETTPILNEASSSVNRNEYLQDHSERNQIGALSLPSSVEVVGSLTERDVGVSSANPGNEDGEVEQNAGHNQSV